MRSFILTSFLFICVLSAHGSPLVENISARESISLDGKWRYIVDPLENGYYDHRLMPLKRGFFENRQTKGNDLVEYNFSTAEQINVPGDWNSQDDRLFFYEGTIWYQRDFSLAKCDTQRYYIYFGAVNYTAMVYVNGKYVGSHTGGYTSFNFDVTDFVTNGKNFVVVKVDNRRHRDAVPTVNMDWWNYGGITRSVSLLSLPKVHLMDYTVKLANKSQSDIICTAKLNTAEAGVPVGFEIPELKIALNALTNANGEVTFSCKAKPKLWSPDAPKLYDVKIVCDRESVSNRIGFRTLAVDGTKIMLNGESVFLKGISIHEEAPYGSGRAWSSEQAQTLLGWAKELGCNYVRLAHYPHNENMVRMAEELGLMVWSEIPVYWTISWDNEQTYANADNQLSEMIARDKNRCGIVIWSVANETPHGDSRDIFLKRLIKKARSLDDTRLISMAMEVAEDKGGVNTLSDNMSDFVDILSFNQYVGWYRATNDEALKMQWVIPYNKPVIISEFGGGAQQGLHGDKSQRWTEEYQSYLYECNLVMLDKIKELAGMSPWILVDFRSARRQIPDIQDFYNRKGLISDRGIRKKAFYTLQNYYKQK